MKNSTHFLTLAGVVVVAGAALALGIASPRHASGMGTSHQAQASSTNTAGNASGSGASSSATSATGQGASASTANQAGGSLAQRVENSVIEHISGIKQPMNILLVANNARHAKSPLSLGTAGGQADIMIVAHVDPVAHQVSLISIPRDTLVALPQWNAPIPKIKSVFTLGLNQSPTDGPKYLTAAVSKLVGMSIQSYIVTDFQGFVDAINAVGGIQVNVPARLYDPTHSGVNLQPGLQTLNGQQALAYIRVRQNQAGNGYRITDFQRQQAEIQVLQILKKKVLDSTSNPVKLYNLVQVWSKDVATNVSMRKLAGIGLAVKGSSVQQVTIGSDADSMDLAGTSLPGVNKENYLTGAYYDVLDPAKIEEKLAPFGSSGSTTGLPPLPTPDSVNVTVYGRQSVATRLRKDGFHVIYGGASKVVSRETVYYPAGHIQMGWVVGRALGSGNEWVAPSAKANNGVIVYTP